MKTLFTLALIFLTTFVSAQIGETYESMIDEYLPDITEYSKNYIIIETANSKYAYLFNQDDVCFQQSFLWTYIGSKDLVNLMNRDKSKTFCKTHWESTVTINSTKYLVITTIEYTHKSLFPILKSTLTKQKIEQPKLVVKKKYKKQIYVKPKSYKRELIIIELIESLPLKSL